MVQIHFWPERGNFVTAVCFGDSCVNNFTSNAYWVKSREIVSKLCTNAICMKHNNAKSLFDLWWNSAFYFAPKRVNLRNREIHDHKSCILWMTNRANWLVFTSCDVEVLTSILSRSLPSLKVLKRSHSTNRVKHTGFRAAKRIPDKLYRGTFSNLAVICKYTLLTKGWNFWRANSILGAENSEDNGTKSLGKGFFFAQRLCNISQTVFKLNKMFKQYNKDFFPSVQNFVNCQSSTFSDNFFLAQSKGVKSSKATK